MVIGEKWNLPANYGTQFLAGLKVFNLQPVTEWGNSLIVEVPTGSTHPKRSAWFLLTDNGGELVVWEINNYAVPAVDVPYTSCVYGTINPLTLVNRIAALINGHSIDWSFRFSDEESALVCR